MEDGTIQFRGVTFGGFHRQDVMNYMTSTASEHERAMAALTVELEQKSATAEEQTKRAEDLEAKLAAAEARVTALQTALEQAELEREQTNDRLLLKETELNDVRTDANDAIAALRAEVRTLEPKAQAYDKLKERSAGIELDAHRRAQSTLDDAERDAMQIRQEQAKNLREVQVRYELLRSGLRESFERSAAELEEVCRSFERITGDFDSYEDTLGELVAQVEESVDADSIKKLAGLLR